MERFRKAMGTESIARPPRANHTTEKTKGTWTVTKEVQVNYTLAGCVFVSPTPSAPSPPWLLIANLNDISAAAAVLHHRETGSQFIQIQTMKTPPAAQFFHSKSAQSTWIYNIIISDIFPLFCNQSPDPIQLQLFNQLLNSNSVTLSQNIICWELSI